MFAAFDAARRAFSYLSEIDLPDATGQPFDAVVGFGMFDLSLPVFCGDLYRRGEVRRIVFTGGIGAGTGDLDGPEAEVWRGVLRRSHPEIPVSDVIVESRSTNTGENVEFTAEVLRRNHPALAFGAGIQRVIVVASPTRLRRVWLTLRHREPGLTLTRRLPADTSLDADRTLYAGQGIEYVTHLVGELDRIVAYPARGWIAAEPLPPDVEAARTELRRSAGLVTGYRTGHVGV